MHLQEKIKPASQITVAYGHCIVAYQVIGFDYSPRSDLVLGFLTFRNKGFFEEEPTTINDYRWGRPGTKEFGELVSFLGQTAQLFAFSAAGFYLPVDIVRVKNHQFYRVCGDCRWWP